MFIHIETNNQTCTYTDRRTLTLGLMVNRVCWCTYRSPTHRHSYIFCLSQHWRHGGSEGWRLQWCLLSTELCPNILLISVKWSYAWPSPSASFQHAGIQSGWHGASSHGQRAVSMACACLSFLSFTFSHRVAVCLWADCRLSDSVIF